MEEQTQDDFVEPAQRVNRKNMRVKVMRKTFQGLKRAPAPLTVSCGVCSAPAPDHLHFGGETSIVAIEA